ncbi:sensor histidine kinase [Cohnella soli]|uniref:histidine kinase n=1 Tax=Cohnella soli TaxID=425005 RepID=A0ABW0I1B9_9BACL
MSIPNKIRPVWLLQAFSITFSIVTLLFFISAIPKYYENLRTKCVLQSCGPLAPAPPTTIEALNRYHYTPDTYALAFVIIDCVLPLLFYIASAVIIWKCKRRVMGSIAALALVAYGTTFPSLVDIASEGISLWVRWYDAVRAVGWISLFLLFLLFPTGRFSPSRTYFVFIPFSIVQIVSFAFPDTVLDLENWSGIARIIYYLSAIGTMIYSQFYRYMKVSSSEERQQTKWVVYGISISFLGFIGVSGFFVYPVFNENPTSYIYLNAALHIFVALIPLTLTFAILRHRLWDIDPLVNRTIVYGALYLSIVLIYSFSVLYLIRVFQTKENFLISLMATSIVAFLFMPLKVRLQRIVSRIMKGKHDDPFAVLSELGDHLVKPIDHDTLLDIMVKTIQDALRLPYVGISIRIDGEEKLIAVAGKTAYDMQSIPIIHGGVELGKLLISSRSPGEVFTSEDRKLLDVLLRQAGQIVHSVNMARDMKHLAKDLQDSRSRLIYAREEERRQIRRNLHDDLAPRLMSLAFNVAAAEQYIEKNPNKAVGLLGELRATIRSTVDDIRTMVHDLRPPTLDEFGLIGSIKARIEDAVKTSEQVSASLHITPLSVKLHIPQELPDLPAAVEVAAYRIVTESLVNIIKHAKATNCDVYLQMNSENELQIEVVDNGIGIPVYIKSSGNGGIGLTSIRERARELGGQCEFERLESGGTRVKALLPFSQGEEQA